MVFRFALFSLFFLISCCIAQAASDCPTGDAEGIYSTVRDGSHCIISYEPDAVNGNDITISSDNPAYTTISVLSVADSEKTYQPDCDKTIIQEYREHTLIRFDLSSIQNDSIVEEASLLLHPSFSQFNAYVNAYPMRVSWDSGRLGLASGKALVMGANWDYSDSTRSLPWGGTVPGVHHDISPAASTYVKQGKTEGYVSFDVTRLVGQWVDGSRENNGVVLKCNGDSSKKCAVSFDSSGTRAPEKQEEGAFNINAASAMFACSRCTGGGGVGLPSPSYKPVEPGRSPPVLVVKYLSVPLTVRVPDAPQVVIENEKKQLSVEIENNGELAVSGGKLIVKGQSDGSLIGEYDIGEIAPGQKRLVQVGPVDFSKISGAGIIAEAKLPGAYNMTTLGVFVAPAPTLQNAFYAIAAILALAIISAAAVFLANAALSSKARHNGKSVCPLCRHKGKGGSCPVCGSSY